ncbi:MAG: extracellular solute-binding protein [Oscillospiraceae bacterium]|nr:extracellular solute-binding protein [Oscillospiraceae bacterium]MCL2158338.1 extracellular solute-binding protein [Oscillospiraceae bacterium]MCL2158879.1 extracellular solute-binding protein [Oscillospiraceae bacterium]
MATIPKKFICALLVLSMAALAACAPASDAQNNAPDASHAQADANEGMPSEALDVEPDLPDLDMKGRTVTFLTSNWGGMRGTPDGEAIWGQQYDILVEELTGEALNDATYNRNKAMEDKYNCVIAEINVAGQGDANNMLNKAVKAGDPAYDVMLCRMQSYQNLGASGTIIDLNELEYIDFESPWWDQNSVKDLSILNRRFMVCGDITISDNGATGVFVFNKKLLAENELDDPYKLVKEGTWTLEKFFSMTKEISRDLDGDGTMDENDRYGFFYQRDTVLSFLNGSGERVGKKDENDIPYITLGSESAISNIMYTFENLYDKNACFNVMHLTGDFNLGMDAMFQNDQALFMWIRMVNIVPLRSMPTDFGVLPIPKKDAAQNYYSCDVNSWTGLGITVPATVSDMEEMGIFLEAYAAESRKRVNPAYYDVLLSGKVARDDESLEMLDIIFGNRTYDIGAIGTYGTLNEVIYMVMNYDLNVTSWVDKRTDKAQKDIEKLVEKISNLD